MQCSWIFFSRNCFGSFDVLYVHYPSITTLKDETFEVLAPASWLVPTLFSVPSITYCMPWSSSAFNCFHVCLRHQEGSNGAARYPNSWKPTRVGKSRGVLQLWVSFRSILAAVTSIRSRYLQISIRVSEECPRDSMVVAPQCLVLGPRLDKVKKEVTEEQPRWVRGRPRHRHPSTQKVTSLSVLKKRHELGNCAKNKENRSPKSRGSTKTQDEEATDRVKEKRPKF